MTGKRAKFFNKVDRKAGKIIFIHFPQMYVTFPLAKKVTF